MSKPEEDEPIWHPISIEEQKYHKESLVDIFYTFGMDQFLHMAQRSDVHSDTLDLFFQEFTTSFEQLGKKESPANYDNFLGKVIEYRKIIFSGFTREQFRTFVSELRQSGLSELENGNRLDDYLYGRIDQEDDRRKFETL